jgi:hypothetical protein
MWYEVDIRNFDVAKDLQNMGLYKHEYVRLIHDSWVDVLNEIYKSVGDFGETPQDILKTFLQYRGNNAGNYIYDICFNVDNAINLVKNSNREAYKVYITKIFDQDDYIDYTKVDYPFTYTPNEPIILIPDLVSSREALYKQVNEIPKSLLVLDGNNRVTLMKNSEQPYIHAYYISLDELLEYKIFISDFDSAVYCQMADLVYILKQIDETNVSEIIKDYYKQSYLVRSFSKYIK